LTIWTIQGRIYTDQMVNTIAEGTARAAARVRRLDLSFFAEVVRRRYGAGNFLSDRRGYGTLRVERR